MVSLRSLKPSWKSYPASWGAQGGRKFMEMFTTKNPSKKTATTSIHILLSSWWFQQSHLKNMCKSIWESSSPVRDENSNNRLKKNTTSINWGEIPPCIGVPFHHPPSSFLDQKFSLKAAKSALRSMHLKASPLFQESRNPASWMASFRGGQTLGMHLKAWTKSWYPGKSAIVTFFWKGWKGDLFTSEEWGIKWSRLGHHLGF